MTCILWGVVALRATKFFLLAVTLVLSLNIPIDARGQESEPTLKDVIGGSKQEPQKGEAAKTPQATPKPSVAPGATAKEAAPVAKAIVPHDAYDRGTPRRSVKGLMEAAAARDYEKAAEYLDLRFLPPWYSESDGARFARKLKIVVDRAPLWIDPARLSDAPAGDPRLADGLPEYRDRLGRIKTATREVDVILDRVSRPRRRQGLAHLIGDRGRDSLPV